MSWRAECIEVARRLNASQDVIDRIEQYASDEIGYDNPEFPDPEKFVKEEMDNLKEET